MFTVLMTIRYTWQMTQSTNSITIEPVAGEAPREQTLHEAALRNVAITQGDDNTISEATTHEVTS
jgi:hypothetical protein